MDATNHLLFFLEEDSPVMLFTIPSTAVEITELMMVLLIEFLTFLIIFCFKLFFFISPTFFKMPEY